MKRALFALAAALLALAPSGSANASLKTVQKVFIEKMEADFDNDLRVQITRQFKGRVNVVLDRDMADAILIGVNKDDKASNAKATLRYLGLDSATGGTLTLFDKSGKVVLWADEAGDRAKAQDAYRKLLELAREADTQRPELARAKTYLASK